MKVALIGSALLLSLLTSASADRPASAQLWEYRNLGKAFYENPDTHQQALEQLRHALDLAPGSVREKINYGLALLRAGQVEQGVSELLAAQKQDAALPHTWFNLGIAYKHAGDYDKAIAQFQGMIRLVPDEPAAHYNLAAVLRSKGDNQAALAEFLTAEKLNPDLAGPHFQLFTLYQRAHETEKAATERKQFEAAKKRNDGAAVPEDMEWCYYAELYDPPDPRPGFDAKTASLQEAAVSQGWKLPGGLLPIDSEGNGHADLLVWDGSRIALLKRGRDMVDAGLEKVPGALAVIPGDYDNDGKTDLCILSKGGAALFHNAGGKFIKTLDFPAGQGATAGVWLDFDHDNDLDLLLFGPAPALLRNSGEGKFEDRSSSFPFAKGSALDAVVTAMRDDTAARDVVVSYSDRAGTLYRDRLNGKFEAITVDGLKSGVYALSVQDVDHDGLLDLVAYAPKAVVLRNADESLHLASDLKPVQKPVRADFNGDDREDYAELTSSGEVRLFTSDSPQTHWLSVRIEGVKNLKTAPNATVEVKSAGFYDKRIYAGVPLAFPLGDRTVADTVRITWPNGLIQNETEKKTGVALNVQEAQRLSGSCPMIFTWDGDKFRFITDVLGVAPLGASSGDGHYFPVDHDEYIQIPGSALQADNGSYRLRITEELHEISYLDKVQLIALDHPRDLRIYTNDKFKSPPYPEFRLYGSSHPVHPVSAREERDGDVTSRVAAVDSSYPDGFHHNAAGVAELHTLDLDFGKAAPDNDAVLVLNGWVDWADGSTFLGAAQGGHSLAFPSIQVKNRAGQWQTVVDDMGIPSGKPKTIAVDLSGKFLTADRHVRIVTNLCIYWDEISLLESAAAPRVRLTPMVASAANLHFRGFSKVLVDPRRQQPERFVYDEVHPVSNWNPTPGRYTRYGKVERLVEAADDKLLIMGSGDEVKLEYSAAHLAPLPVGWSRDFLLLVDGWAKDADANTAYSQSVLPLPFHGMSAYPYRSTEHFPNDPDHREYQEEFLSRPALKLIRPLASARRR